MNFLILSGCVSAISWICWLINKKDERNFCKNAGKDAIDNYIGVLRAKKQK